MEKGSAATQFLDGERRGYAGSARSKGGLRKMVAPVINQLQGFLQRRTAINPGHVAGMHAVAANIVSHGAAWQLLHTATAT